MQVNDILNNAEIIVVPFVNPDGYVVSNLQYYFSYTIYSLASLALVFIFLATVSLACSNTISSTPWPAVHVAARPAVEEEPAHSRLSEGQENSLCGCGHQQEFS